MHVAKTSRHHRQMTTTTSTDSFYKQVEEARRQLAKQMRIDSAREVSNTQRVRELDEYERVAA